MPDEIPAFYASPGIKKEDSAPLTLKGRYVEMDAMHFWGLTPREWRMEEPADRAEMMAFAHSKRAIEGYQVDWSRMNTDNKKPAKG